MSEAAAGRSSAPTPKMIAFATKIAERVLPDKTADEEYQEAILDFDACKEFIDKYKEQANKPSEKALAFAQRISKEVGVEIPTEALQDSRELSKWIDANKQD